MQSHTIEELQTLRVAYQEQQSALAAAQQDERKLQQQAQSLQQEVEQLRAESRKSAQYADLQRQFQEVRVCPQHEALPLSAQYKPPSLPVTA